MGAQYIEEGDGGSSSEHDGPSESHGVAEHNRTESPGNDLGNAVPEGKLAGVELYDRSSIDFGNPSENVSRMIDRYLEQAKLSLSENSIHDIYEQAFLLSADARKQDPLNETLRNTEYYLMCATARQGDSFVDSMMTIMCLGAPVYDSLKVLENIVNDALSSVGIESSNLMRSDKSNPNSKPGGWIDAWRGLFDGGSRLNHVDSPRTANDPPPRLIQP